MIAGIKNSLAAFLKAPRPETPSIPSTLSDSTRTAFSEVPQQVYVLSDGANRQVVVSSVTAHDIRENVSYVSFNLGNSEKNSPFFTDEEYYIHALSGNAVKLLEKNSKDAKKLVRSGEDKFIWTMKVVTAFHQIVFGKSIVVARIIEVERDQNTSGLTAIYQNRQFWRF